VIAGDKTNAGQLTPKILVEPEIILDQPEADLHANSTRSCNSEVTCANLAKLTKWPSLSEFALCSASVRLLMNLMA
jgi:hypothetical protein